MTFKQRDIQPCALCDRGLAHDGNFLFWRLRFERLGLDRSAISRHAGLEQMLGSAPLAAVMGIDADLAKTIVDPCEILVCEPCVTDQMIGLFLAAEKTLAKGAAK